MIKIMRTSMMMIRVVRYRLGLGGNSSFSLGATATVYNNHSRIIMITMAMMILIRVVRYRLGLGGNSLFSFGATATVLVINTENKNND